MPSAPPPSTDSAGPADAARDGAVPGASGASGAVAGVPSDALPGALSSAPAVAPSPEPAPGARATRPGRRWWPLALLLLPIVLLAAALWAWQQPPTLPWLLGQVPGLQTEGVRLQFGPQRLQIDQLRWQAPAQAGTLSLRQVTVQGWQLRWRPHPGAWIGLRLDQVDIGQLRWTSGTPGAPATAPPPSLRLPFALDLGLLQVQQAQVDQQPPLRALRARLALGDRAGALHHGSLLGAVLALGTAATDPQRPPQTTTVGLAGTWSLGADGDLPLRLLLAAQSPQAGGWRGTAQVQGPLATLQADLSLSALGGPLAGPAASTPLLQAQATVQPWQAWPLRALQLHSRALDLNTLSPEWPRTALSGQARLHTSGLNQPAQADIQLDNALPGRLDQQRLPLQRLRVRTSAGLRALDQLRFEQLQVELADGQAPAGTVRGEGRWQAGTAEFTLQLEALQPARLHQAAAAVRLSGPVTLALQGLPLQAGGSSPPGAAAPVLQWQLAGTLDGQPTAPAAGTPGVRLRWQAQGQPGQLQLREALASAGPAQAQASGSARWGAAGWQADGKLTLSNFDPRPWWRGAEGSAWRRGPHRLAGALTLRLQGPGSPAQLASTPWHQTLASLVGDAGVLLAPSLLAGVPLQGTLSLQGQRGQVTASGQLQAASNQLTLQARSLNASGPGALAQATARTPGQPGQPGQPNQPNQPALPGLQLQATWQLPNLAELAPWRAWLAETQAQAAAAWPRQGSTSGELQLQRAQAAAPGAWASSGSLQANKLTTDLARLAQADLRWQWGAGDDDPLTLQLSGQGLVADTWRVDQLQARADGSRRLHRLSLQVDSPLRPPDWTEALLGRTGTGSRLQWQAEGSWPSRSGQTTQVSPRLASSPKPDHLGSTANTANAATPTLGPLAYSLRAGQLQWGAREGGSRTPWVQGQNLAAELRSDGQGAWQQLLLAPGRLQLASTTALRWQTLSWTAANGGRPDQLNIDADLEAFDVARLLNRLQPGTGWGGNLTLGGRIQVSAGAQLAADIVLERGTGDLSLTDELGGVQPLGLTDLRLAFSAHDGLWQFAQGLAGSSIGTLVGAQEVRTGAERRWPTADAPLQGVLQARVGNLAAWGAWVPPGWRLAGTLDVQGDIGGRFGAPELRGSMQGRQLALRNLLEGVNLSDGTLDLALEGDTARIDRFEFKGGDGTLVLTGGGTLGAQPSARLVLQAERFRLLGRLDRRLVVSGRSTLQLSRNLAQLNGQLRVDEGLIDLSRGDAPSLDSDVRVNRLSAAEAAQAKADAPALSATRAAQAADSPSARPVQVQVQLGLDLGERLRLQGQGIDTHLRGQLQITTPDNRLAVTGTVRTQDGRYAAYGQKLDIERGEAVFTGALDNPRLDILATRPNLDVVVGVAVSGSPGNPRVRLFSEPELSDYDKLSWLVLGRSPDGLGNADTALLQRAAIALLAGNETAPTDQFINALGLTDFSVRQTDGDTRDTIISLGKQLSRRWYVGYERGVNATIGTWQLVYRVAQRFTLRAQSGEDNAVDLIWSWRW